MLFFVALAHLLLLFLLLSYALYKQKKKKDNFEKTIDFKKYQVLEAIYKISREGQPELLQLRFKKDNYICQKCKKHKDELIIIQVSIKLTEFESKIFETFVKKKKIM